MKKGLVYVGTSGWNYKHWVGLFYPEKIKTDEQLTFYLMHFGTVELNNSFYRLPNAAVFEKWYADTPGHFRFSVKASRYITHVKKLKDAADAVLLFTGNADMLKEKLGPILFQLPPLWNTNADRLKAFIRHLPTKHRFVFEFRNETWYNNEIFNILKDGNCAFCIYELDGHHSPEAVTADFVYIRLHGPGNKYQGSYHESTLRDWSEKCKLWLRDGKDVYVYFDNDQNAYAPMNALRLLELLSPEYPNPF